MWFLREECPTSFIVELLCLVSSVLYCEGGILSYGPQLFRKSTFSSYSSFFINFLTKVAEFGCCGYLPRYLIVANFYRELTVLVTVAGLGLTSMMLSSSLEA